MIKSSLKKTRQSPTPQRKCKSLRRNTIREHPPYLTEHKSKTLRLTLYIQPRASRNRIAGLHGDAVKLAITTPPVNGKANAAVISYIAALFKVPKQAVRVKSGHTSRTKILVIENISLAEAQTLLDQALDTHS